MCFSFSQDILSGHYQLIVVTTRDWDESLGTAQVFQRQNDTSAWSELSRVMPVVLGKAGLAWGIGLHPSQTSPSIKREGDRKSPAGIFTIGPAFGFAPPSEMAHLKIGYLPLTSEIEAIDDPHSRYYNCIVHRKEIACDWKSSEKMGEIPLYKLGFVINHNFPNPQPGGGSAIFFHIWRNSHSGTAGCTAASLEDLSTILSLLNQSKNPVLIQLPISTYSTLQQEWSLPACTALLSLPQTEGKDPA